ncbi:MAG: oligosaccharide flippase family protein [Actinobacteria bacterium]|nr:oligosaccharide flippase family protein [Actinomycetota bacterium]
MVKSSRTLFYADSLSGSLPLYSAAHILFRVVGLIRMILFTWLLGKDQFGVFSVALAFTNLTASMVLLGTPSALERYIPLYQNTHNLKAFLRRLIPLCLLIAVVGTVLLATNVGAVSSAVFSLTARALPSPEAMQAFFQLTAVCIAAIFAAACFHMVISCLKGLRFFRAVAAMELGHAFFFTGLAVVLLSGFICKPAVVLAAQALSMALLAGIFGLALIFSLRRTPSQDESLASTGYLSRFTSFAVWGLPSTITWRLLIWVFPIWYLNRKVGPGASGVYQAYFTLANSIFFLSVPFWSVMNIHAVRSWVQARYEQTRSTVEVGFRAFSLLLLAICLVLTLAAPLLRYVFSADFAAGAHYVRLLCLPALLAANFGLVHLLSHLLERPSLRVLALTFGVVVLLIAGYFLIPAYGITGAALSGALGLAVATFLGLILLSSRRYSLSVSSWIVLFCPALLLISNHYLLVVSFMVLISLAVFSPLLFSAQDKRYLIDSCREAVRRYLPQRLVS